MKRKILLLLLIIIATTGCSVDYHIEIKDDNIVEETTFTQTVNSRYTKKYMLELYNNEYPIYYDEEFMYYSPNEKRDEYTYYGKELKETSNGYSAIYKATYTFSNYKRARFFNEAYATRSISYNDDDVYSIMASNLKLFNSNNGINEINITIDFDGYEIVGGNYHNIDDSTCVWNFKRGDTGNINVQFKEINKVSPDSSSLPSTPSSSNQNNKKNTSKYELYIFLGILLILILIGYKVFENMKQKSNNMDD